jgi:hypothetical protein
MKDKYFRTKSKTFALAIQYVTNRNFYKFKDENECVIYSFEADDELYKKIKQLNNIKFS